MKLSKLFAKNMKYQKDVGYVIPSSIAASIIFLVIIIDSILGNYSEEHKRLIAISIGVGGSLYIIFQTLLVAPRIQKYRPIYIWVNAVASGLGLSLLAVVLDETHHTFFDILLILAVTSNAILSGRGPTHLLIVVSKASYIFAHQGDLVGFTNLVIHLIPVIAAVVITETILRLRQATQNQIRRLEMLNTFSQQINSSLETEQVLSILNAALQKAIDADSYYVGLVDQDTIRLDLFYDEGEYFNDVKIPLTGTFSGWVIENQKPLFLPDLREDVQLEGIHRMQAGNTKPSLSWMGVPMKTAHITGLSAVSSYTPNAFSQGDMELLSNLAQHAALALDNTIHHQRVEEQARLDSLTGTYNHRYFLQALQEHIDQVNSNKQVISLIMLDIDFFKQYNDTYGHQVGDEILIKLCETIQKYTKKTDFVGRWGGEEFAIALPGAGGDVAYQVAERVQKSMQSMTLLDPKQVKIPAPTVSQGISVFPDEAVDINHFVYLADQRLYVAKERGRNQIEPDLSRQKSIQSSKRNRGASR
jgi:diguanylate cyclase (GGDEF)-like protein